MKQTQIIIRRKKTNLISSNQQNNSKIYIPVPINHCTITSNIFNIPKPLFIKLSDNKRKLDCLILYAVYYLCANFEKEKPKCTYKYIKGKLDKWSEKRIKRAQIQLITLNLIKENKPS